MDYPNFIAELQRIDYTERIALEGQRDFENAGAEAVHRLRGVGFPAFGSDRERRKTDRLRAGRERLEFR